MHRVHRYVESMSKTLNLPSPADSDLQEEEIVLPTSASAWAEMFNDDPVEAGLEKQFYFLEQLGYLLQSQSIIGGR